MSQGALKSDRPDSGGDAASLNGTIIFADTNGAMQEFPNAPDFWMNTVAGLPEGYLISQYTFTESWPNWERHPRGDEFVVVLSGSITFIFKSDGGDERRELSQGDFSFIPQNKWHSADLSEPVTALFVTFGKGTENKPR